MEIASSFDQPFAYSRRAAVKGAGLWKHFRKEVSEPEHAMFHLPCFLPVAVEAMQSGDALIVRLEENRNAYGTYSGIGLRQLL